MKLEKTEAETEIQTLTERITLAEETERRYKAKEPEIKHYLEQFALVKKELDRRNEDLSALGYPPPQIDYTFPPSRLFEDETSNGRATTSHTGPSERADRADPRIIEDHIPSVSSTTLRADSSRTYTEDDIQGTGNKRQKIADYRYIPQNMQSPSRESPARKWPGIRLPPASSITQKIPSRSTHFQPPPITYQSNNSQFTFVSRNDDVRAGPQAMSTQHETWEPWRRTEANHKPDTRSDDPPYMSGALQSDGSDFAKPAAPFRPPKQQKRKIQPVDSIDDVSRSYFITSERLLTSIPSHRQYDIGGDVDSVPRRVSRTASTNLGSGSGYRVLDGKVAIVTGASRGIGAATCENLASKGCSLIMNYTSDSSESITTQLAERLQKEHGIKALPVQADMGTENGPAHLIATALNHFAHPKTRKLQIDIIINNAGVASNRRIEDCDADDFDFVYRVNVRGPLFLMKAALPYLPTDRSGRIVNVSSVSASCGFSEQSVYGGSKAAVEAMTRTWARELAERTTVNAINPGPVMTDMWSGVTKEFQEGIAPWLKTTPLAAVRPGIDSEDLVKGAEVAGGRPAYESETAGVIAMLCTPDAAYTTGSVISCNGGFKFST
ncbi:NAD(P)-binding protein, partial [Aureobasidium melanogenum]